MESAYESPKILEVGSLHELTLKRHKFFSQKSDFIYPQGFSFNFS
jgi:hypothetical protein